MTRHAPLAAVLVLLASWVSGHATAPPQVGHDPAFTPDPADLTGLPLLGPDTQAHYISSFDRTGGNDDGFRGTYSALYVDDRGEHVIVDVKGPGCLYTLWFTSRENGWAKLGWGRIRFYLDDDVRPRVEMDADELYGGERAPFVKPFVFGPFESTGGHVSYLPIPFQKRLRITTEGRVGFYNAYYHTFTPDRRVETWTGREDRSATASAWRAVGSDPKSATVDRVLRGTVDLPAPAMPDGDPVPAVATVFEHEGAGAITALRMNPLFPLSTYQLNHIVLRAYWDGESTPSVEAPLGSFFGSGLGEAAVRALPLGMSPSGDYYCYLPMPFWTRARLELVNENPGPVPTIRWEARLATGDGLYPRDGAGHFKARYRREWPTKPGVDYLILDTRGRGRYLGQVMTVEPIRPEVKRWWEGDLRVLLDDRRQPAFHGTGHEDEYLGGWSNEWLMNPYSLPMHGEPRTDGLTQVDFQWSAATTVYRFFVGGIPFERRIVVSTEHGAGNTADAMYSSVAYFYERPDGMEKIDAIDVGTPSDEQRHGYALVTPAGERSGVTEPMSLTSRFEGPDDATMTDQGREVAGRSRFRLSAPGSPAPLRLRRLYDQARLQEAEVWVNGSLAGVWYSPATNSARRWAESDFLLPAALTQDRSSIDVEIRVVQGPWSEFRYELYGKR